jgi:two-component system sensor kinase FixL
MSWVTVVWSMGAAVCLSFAAVHLLVWLNLREARSNLLFAIGASAAAAATMIELAALRADTPAAYGEAIRWMYVPVSVAIVAVVWFVRTYLRAGRLWLAWGITVLRALVLVPNFASYPNASFGEITQIGSMLLLGEAVAVPVGTPSPWRALAQAAALLLVIYVVDAVVVSWRRQDRRRALVVGSAVTAAVLLGVLNSQLMVLGLLPGPFTGLVFLLIVMAMGWELSLNLIRAGELARSVKEAQQRMELVTLAADLGLWEWDIDRDEVWADAGTRAMAGFGPSDDLSLDGYLQRIQPDDREAVRQVVMRSLLSDDGFRMAYRVAGPEGSTRWIAAQGKVIRGTHGEPVRLRGVTMDVTDRRRDEAELQRQREDLARLQRASAVGQLSTVLAHELNQPLGAILRNAEAAELLLQQERPDLKELSAIVADIRSDDQRAAEVIQRMRALLQRHSPQFETMDLRELVTQVVDLVGAEFQARHATLDLRVPSGLPGVLGDRVHLQQVLLNLLLNGLEAVQDVAEERRTLTIEALQGEDGWVEVAVRDRGLGFAAGQAATIFEPFVSTKAGGTGLGLAISRTIIEAHGGRIWAENAPDGSAIVRFTLKAAQDRGDT